MHTVSEERHFMSINDNFVVKVIGVQEFLVNQKSLEL